MATSKDGKLVLLRRTSCNDHDMYNLTAWPHSQAFHWQLTADASSARALAGAGSALSQGGISYVQSYNVVKNLLCSVDRTASNIFSDLALILLAFTQSTLDLWDQRSGRRGAKRRCSRIAKSLCAAISRVRNALYAQTTRAEATGYAARQEYRMLWHLFMSFEPSAEQPSIHASGANPMH